MKNAAKRILDAVTTGYTIEAVEPNDQGMVMVNGRREHDGVRAVVYDEDGDTLGIGVDVQAAIEDAALGQVKALVAMHGQAVARLDNIESALRVLRDAS